MPLLAFTRYDRDPHIAGWIFTAFGIGAITGSMLVVAPTGNQFRQATIDNSTWRIRNGGLVDCEEALAKAANAGNDVRSPGSRLELIRQGFRGAP